MKTLILIIASLIAIAVCYMGHKIIRKILDRIHDLEDQLRRNAKFNI